MLTCWQFPTIQISWKIWKKEKNPLPYCDDRLAIFKNDNGPISKKFKKYFCKLFREHDLELTVQFNREVGNSSYRLYLIGNNKIIYVSAESDHPPSIIKQLPRLSQSSTKKLSPWYRKDKL